MTEFERGRQPRVPASILLKLRLGEAPSAVPTTFDTRAGAAVGSQRLGLSAVDRVLRRSTDDLVITRVHASARSIGTVGRGHVGFDDVEHALGLSRTFRVDVDAQADPHRLLADLRSINEVEAAGPNLLCATPFGRMMALDAGSDARDRINAAAAAGYEPGDPSVTVAVLDTGVTTSASQVGRNVRRGYDSVQLASGELGPGMRLIGDNLGIDAEPLDEVGHGTACASIIAGSGDASLAPGLAAGCTLLPVRVLGSVQVGHTSSRVGVGSVHDIDVGFKRAIDLDAKVLNLSFGTPLGHLNPMDPIPHEDVVAYALARGCILIAASGNSGRSERYSPAALDGVIAVGATDSQGQPAQFSTRGDHVALCAPGERVLAAGLDGPAMVTGTSFAAPFVTATAALLVSRAARRAEPFDAWRVRAVLARSARPWTQGTPGGHGAGQLDALAALRTLDAELDRGPPAVGLADPSTPRRPNDTSDPRRQQWQPY